MRRLQGQVLYDEPSVVQDETQGVVEAAPTIEDLLSLAVRRLESWQYRYVKRTLDVTGALLMNNLA